MAEVVTSKAVSRDLAGYIVGIYIRTNHNRVFCFDGREAALWANRTYQQLQAINPKAITVKHTIEQRGKRAA